MKIFVCAIESIFVLWLKLTSCKSLCLALFLALELYLLLLFECKLSWFLVC
nr:MAG TPA: hypothetical protein [Caudoviricetes sp.]